jgi:transcriptional regulator with XRE-family HTH domain
VAQFETLGLFLAKLMERQNLSNRELARLAEVSEGAVRNLLRYGDDPRAKDPDPRTLSKVAIVLKLDPLVLFRLAGYIPPSSQSHLTTRGLYLAQIFEKLPLDRQMALLGAAEAFTADTGLGEDAARIKEMREHPRSEMAGFDVLYPNFIRSSANVIIRSGALAETDMVWPEHLEVSDIPANIKLGPSLFGELPDNLKEKIAALIREKFALDFDSSMVDEEWRY